MKLSFPFALFLSLCFSIGPNLPVVLGRSLPAYSATSLASPLYRRTGPDPGHVQEQVNDLFKVLSSVKANKISPRGGNSGKGPTAKLDEHVKTIYSKLPNKQNLRILFVEYAGSGGDVGKSMTYAEAINSQSVRTGKTDLFNRILYYFRSKKATQPKLEMKLAVDCNYLKYMTQQVRDTWKSDIEHCIAGDGTDSDANQKKFMNVVNDYLKSWKPHVVIQGNAISGLYKASEGFWTEFHEPMNALVKQDSIVRVNVRADFKKAEEVKTKLDQYPMDKNDVVLVGQPADFFKGLPSTTRQTRIGRPQVLGMKAIDPKLKQWLDKRETVMYLGLGGPQRSRELPKHSPTESLNTFMQAMLKDEEYKDWSFIMFHNAVQPAGKEEQNPIDLVGNEERVYHLWYGVDLLSVFSHPNIYMAMHHCGRGILDDTIEAAKVPICLGTSDFSDDQFEFAEAIEENKMGRGIAKKENGVYFEDAKTPKYTGKQKQFTGEKELVTMVKDVLEKWEAMVEQVKKFKEGVVADTSGDLAYEILMNLKYYQYGRNKKSLTGY